MLIDKETIKTQVYPFVGSDRVGSLSRCTTKTNDIMGLWTMFPSFLVVDGKVLHRRFTASIAKDHAVNHLNSASYYSIESVVTLSKEKIEEHFTKMMEAVDLTKKVCYAGSGHYECSTQGDARFSAFSATLPEYNNRSIEQVYQCDIKNFDIGGTEWRKGKGRPPINGKSREQLWEEYFSLWDTWCSNHRVWMHELHYLAACFDYVLSDGYATGVINQARADRKSTRLNSSHITISYAVFCLTE